MKRILPSWLIAISVVLTTVTLLVGGMQAGMARMGAAPLTQSAPTQSPAQPASDAPPAKTPADPAWARWNALPLALQAKVDPRILAELRGLINPAYLGSALDRFVDERGRVVDDRVVGTFRKAFGGLELFHFGPDQVGRVQRIRPGTLKDRDADRRLAVEVAVRVVVARAQLDASSRSLPVSVSFHPG